MGTFDLEENEWDEYEEDELLTEDDYWWIAEDEERAPLRTISEFYNECIKKFKQKACLANVFTKEIEIKEILSDIGEKVATSYLNDRYLVGRRRDNPDIFFDYMVNVSIESGIVIAKKKDSNAEEFLDYVDKIIRETPSSDIEELYSADANFSDFHWRTEFYREITNEWQELLKWYYKTSDFEQYIIKAMTAVFDLGVTIGIEKF